MQRLAGLPILLSTLLFASLSGGQPPTLPKAKAKQENAFRLADQDNDGKVSRQELRKFFSTLPRVKDNPDLAERAFRRFDEDGDGFLSRDEFRQFRDNGPMNKAKGGAKKKGKLAEEESRPANEKVVASSVTSAEGIAFFEKHIRPVLVAECFSCHSTEKGNKIRGGLALDTREGMRKGGDTGAILVPGQPGRSPILQALRHASPKLAMPPKKKLSEDVVANFERWIRMGAPDPRGEALASAPKHEIDIEKGRSFWAFQPPRKTAPPVVKNTAWPRNDVDKFLLASLEARGLSPVGDADRHTLIRRVTFDLIGLPPTREEVEAFVKDPSPDAEALAKVVDRLLEKPQFGERWGRHWLDVARYAETSGKQVNFNYPHAWRYRDWVIASFNADKPYDRFIQEQLAGDLLPARDARERASQQVATGFLAIGSKPHNERNARQFEMDVVDEQIDATTQAFMGLTVACARCHDHKFDPISMKDYYALAGIFRSTQACYGTIPLIQNAHPSSLIALAPESGQPASLAPLTDGERTQIQRQIDRLKEQREELRKDGKLFGSPQGIFTTARMATLQSRLDSYETDGTPKLQAMGVRERTFPRNSPIYARGEVDKAGETVPRGMVQVVSLTPAPTIQKGSGRKELAEWIASADNPLTARVMANRTWLWLFGQGIVGSPDNFGSTGRSPSHPELLDHLAIWFTENGWSVKKLVRHLVLSRAYQLASTHSEANFEVDPDNTLLWRMSKRRLEAEAIR
ncbi:MAG: DUF1549 domain-containing protein, partial [Gemmataceae bacterium]